MSATKPETIINFALRVGVKHIVPAGKYILPEGEEIKTNEIRRREHYLGQRIMMPRLARDLIREAVENSQLSHNDGAALRKRLELLHQRSRHTIIDKRGSQKEVRVFAVDPMRVGDWGDIPIAKREWEDPKYRFENPRSVGEFVRNTQTALSDIIDLHIPKLRGPIGREATHHATQSLNGLIQALGRVID